MIQHFEILLRGKKNDTIFYKKNKMGIIVPDMSPIC